MSCHTVFTGGVSSLLFCQMCNTGGVSFLLLVCPFYHFVRCVTLVVHPLVPFFTGGVSLLLFCQMCNTGAVSKGFEMCTLPMTVGLS